MEKYEFRSKCSLWIWVTGVALIAASILFAYVKGRYELPVIWLIYFALTIPNAMRRYTITPDDLTIKVGWAKPQTFPLKDIVEIERKFYKNGNPKSLLIRYMHSGMPHNFHEIRKSETDINGVLQAIQDYYPGVKVI